MLIEIFGTVAVAAMALFYSLEHRSHRYVLGFSASCGAAALYAALIAAWPFAVIESVWSVVALRRWLERRAATPRGAAP